jgi:hypothetical protein
VTASTTPNIMDVFLEVIQKLESENVQYMVVGSIASMIYGEPRMTHDLDLVIDILPHDAEKIENLFPLAEFYCPPIEVLKSEIVHRGQFNLMHHQSGLKIDLMLRKITPHSVAEFGRRKKVPFWNNFAVTLASPEDVIIKKLVFFREGGSEKHLRDIRGILAETQIENEYISLWIGELGLEKFWAQVVAA